MNTYQTTIFFQKKERREGGREGERGEKKMICSIKLIYELVVEFREECLLINMYKSLASISSTKEKKKRKEQDLRQPQEFTCESKGTEQRRTILQ